MKKYSIFVVAIFLLGALIFFQVFVPLRGSEEKVLFHIEKGEGNEEISIHLEKEGLIRSSFTFRLYVLATGAFYTLKAGDYELNFSMSVAEIAHKIASGDIAKQTLTIIEGWNRKEIAIYLKEKGIAHAEDLGNAEYATLEGYLFPDTYGVRKEAGLEEVIALMQKNFDKKFTQQMKDTASAQKKTIQQIVIMASLIEKEVRTSEDKRIVSGILWKRLDIGMPLQVDATITYITGKQKISVADIKIDSSYNTYKYRGLPAGPIANPGLESIQAALNPEANPYLYYLSTPEGQTIFSKTLQEHNQAKAQYLAE